MQQAVTTLEQELDTLDQRRGEIARAIETIRPFADQESAPVGRSVLRVRKEALRPLHPNDSSEAILAALKVKSPQSPSELATRLKVLRPQVTKLVRDLLAAKLVECTGATMNRQVHLLPRPRAAAKEEP